MKIRVRIEDIEVEIDRPNFADYYRDKSGIYNGPEWRESLFKGSVLPTLTEATNRAKELYQLKNGN